MTDAFTDELFAKQRWISWCTGTTRSAPTPDAYAYPKRVGKYREIKCTEGVSTTDIVGRLLRLGARAMGEEVEEEEKEATSATPPPPRSFGRTRRRRGRACRHVHGAFDVFNGTRGDFTGGAKIAIALVACTDADAWDANRQFGVERKGAAAGQRLGVSIRRRGRHRQPAKITNDLLTTFNALSSRRTKTCMRSRARTRTPWPRREVCTAGLPRREWSALSVAARADNRAALRRETRVKRRARRRITRRKLT